MFRKHRIVVMVLTCLTAAAPFRSDAQPSASASPAPLGAAAEQAVAADGIYHSRCYAEWTLVEAATASGLYDAVPPIEESMAGAGASLPQIVDASSIYTVGYSPGTNMAIEQAVAAHQIYEPLVYETIWEAIEAGDLGDIENHLIHGAKIDERDANGATLLHAAARVGNIPVIDCLLRHGADINAYQEPDISSVLAAVMTGHHDVVHYLCDRGAGYCIEQAVGLGDKDTVTDYLAVTRGTIHDPLEIFNSLNAFSFRGAVGGDIPTPAGEDDPSLLLIATTHARMDMIEFLRSKGASFGEDCSGAACLAEAAIQRNEPLVRVILSDGVNPDNFLNDGGTALHRLVRRGASPEAVELLVKLGASADAPDSRRGVTPLYLAAETGNLALAEALVRLGADVDHGTANLDTPLFAAAREGYADLLGFLLAHDASIDEVDKDGRTALHHAAAANRLAIVQMLLENGATVAIADAAGWTPLHCAAEANNREIAETLVARGARVEAASGPSFTAAHAAAQAGQEAILEYFLTLGIPVDLADSDGRTPLYYALGAKSLPAVNLLLMHGANASCVDNFGETPLFPAAQAGAELTNLIVAKGAQVRVVDKRGRTPLHAAAEAGCFDAARFLVEKGADVNAKDADGNTPLYWAAQMPGPQLFGLLTARGGDVSAVNAEGRTILHAAAAGSTAAVQSLLRTQCDVNARDNAGWTPIHCAADKGNFASITQLWQKGATINAITNDNLSFLDLCEKQYSNLTDTPSMDPDIAKRLRAYEKTLLTIRALILDAMRSATAKADTTELGQLIALYPGYVDEVDDDSGTPLVRAVTAKHMPAVQLLMAAGADPLHKDTEGVCAYDAAIKSGSPEIVTLLKSYRAAFQAVTENSIEKRRELGKSVVEKHLAASAAASTAPETPKQP